MTAPKSRKSLAKSISMLKSLNLPSTYVPGFAIAIAASSEALAALMRRLHMEIRVLCVCKARSTYSESVSIFPTGYVAFRSAWKLWILCRRSSRYTNDLSYPPWYNEMSRLTMSPSCSGLRSGTPWQITSFTEMQQDLVKLR